MVTYLDLTDFTKYIIPITCSQKKESWFFFIGSEVTEIMTYDVTSYDATQKMW